MLDWVIYALVGKLLIYLLMIFPLPEQIEGHWFFGKLHKCDLCLGVWIYWFIAFVFRIDIVSTEFGFHYFPVVGQLVTGGITSFIIHLISLGWKSKFEVVIV